jgi:hypothetical protein
MYIESPEMDGEARSCVFLSGRLSPPDIKVVLATYADVNNAFFGGGGYCQTLAQLTGAHPRSSYCHNNSQKLLELTTEMLSSGCGPRTAHSICCAFNVPVYHLLKVIPDHAAQVKLMKVASSRTHLTSKLTKSKIYEYKQFALFKKSRERNGWWRHAYEMMCLCRFLTADFTVIIVGKNADYFRPSNPRLYRRVVRLIEDGFGGNYEALLGGAAAESAYLAYSLVTDCHSEVGTEEDVFSYTLRPRTYSRGRTEIMGSSPVNYMDWFLAGKHEPAATTPKVAAVVEERASLGARYETLTFPSLEATMHINVQVAHVKVLSKERMLHGVSGKSLVFTVIKKKTVACSSYKAVEADWCVPTCNSLNFNIQGYDLSIMAALVALHKFKRFCSIDDMEPLVVSHARYSTHSFQNGVQNINSFRHKVVRDNDSTCSKVPHFPVVKMVGMGLLHRETVLVNVKPDIEDVAKTIYGVIRGASEIDPRLSELVYELETKVNELVDNQILGIFKTAYMFGREEAARALPDTLLFDRLLVGLNPKTTKSEFADKSKFDSESKGKASKKIKTTDKSKDRKGFLAELDATFPDVFIDPFNSNSRGKWSFVDRFNHSPDWMFYSKFTLKMLDTLRELYPRREFPSFNKMTDEMHRECSKYV